MASKSSISTIGKGRGVVRKTLTLTQRSVEILRAVVGCATTSQPEAVRVATDYTRGELVL
jgi:hypothetical protein